MQLKSKIDLSTAILAIEVVIIVYLLISRVPLTSTAPVSTSNAPTPEQVPPLEVNPQTLNYTPGNYTGGGLTVDPQSFQILFPNAPMEASSDCGCGCDENSPINQSINQLSLFLNQYQNGLAASVTNLQQQYMQGVPAFISQYEQTAGGLYTGQQ